MSLLFLPVLVGGLVRFLSHRRHLLFRLLSLEAIILGLVITISIPSSFITCNLRLIVVFVLAVAEASLGLAVLVSMRRFSDSTLVNS